MLYAVIDVGSHSVRLMLADNNCIKKRINTTRLADNLKVGGDIQPENLERTAQAITDFYLKAKDEDAKEIFIFATEAVRSAKNGVELVKRVKALCGATVVVLDNKQEAEYGFLGAYKNGTCCIIDVGGASSEITVGDENGIKYSKSLPYGIVRLFNIEAQGENLTEFIPKILDEYGQIPPFDNVIAIGGTATAIASILGKMETYDPNVANGFVITADQMLAMYNKVKPMSVEERKNIVGLPDKRADVITSGLLLLYYILQKLGKQSLTVSEGDNLEGLLIKKGLIPKGQNYKYC